MTRQYDVRRSNESPQKDSENWILQRSAVRSQPAKTLTTPETSIGDRSGINLDLMQIPVSNYSAMPVQAKLEIGPANDKYEKEADRVAKQVVQKLHEPQSAQPQKPQTSQGQVNREVEEALQRKTMLQLKGDGGKMTAAPELESSILRSRGSGQPLSEGIREPMEKAFGGVDFSGVRVHTDGQSDQLNRSIQAKAFTTGQDVFFRQEAYAPGSRKGQDLIAHELTHVVQQKSEGEKTVQMKPVLVENKTYKDDKIEGLTLTKLEKVEEVKAIAGKSVNVDQEDFDFQQYYQESFGKTVVIWEGSEYIDCQTNKTWRPQMPNFKWEGRESYVYDKNDKEVQLLEINKINYQGVGNKQDYKKDEIIKGIKGGNTISAITIDSNNKLVNGRNRIEASLECKYKKIPVKIM